MGMSIWDSGSESIVRLVDVFCASRACVKHKVRNKKTNLLIRIISIP
jgi:hypothetical protein